MAGTAACRDPKPTTGSLIVAVDGLPAGADAGVSVQGPNNFLKHVPATTTLENLVPGDYAVTVATTRFSGALYTSPTFTEVHTVKAGRTERATVAYSLGSGLISILISGLPDGVSAALVLDGPAGRRSVSGSGTIGELPAGTYTLRADTIPTPAGDLFATAMREQSIVVPKSLTPVDVNVMYRLASGTLSLTVSGLPSTLSHSPITVTGPAGFARVTSGSITYRGLTPGNYTISAATAAGVCPTTYLPSQPQQIVAVTAGEAATAAVTYVATQAAAANLNLTIDAVHLVQSVQDYGGNVPLVANHPALLRVFGKANQCNSVTPKVRVTLSTGATYTLAAPEASVRTIPEQGSLGASWNVQLPAAVVQPGLSLVADIDPDNLVAESNETDNRYPPSGTRAIDVRIMPTMALRFVPVVIAGQTGRISLAAADTVLGLSRRLLPVGAYDVDVRSAPYTSAQAALKSDDAKGWGSVLGEIEALRVADTSSRYYAGVVRVTYTSGIAGIAYVGGRSSLLWDYLPSASEVAAHELGHNFGRMHSPCGNPGGVDQSYPYAGGYIGRYGYDAESGTLRDPAIFTDIMGYCRNKWISDYTFKGVMDWLITHPRLEAAPSVGSVSVQPALLVWGRIVNGQPVLEPAFEIAAVPHLPAGTGPERLELIDEAGAEIASFAFAAQRIADLPGDQRSFAFAIPTSMLRGRALAAIRLSAPGGTVTSARGAASLRDARAVVTRTGARMARVQWDAAKFPGVMIRDAASGAILSFARGGDVSVATGTGASALEIVYSDRVRSGRVVVPLR